MNTGRERVRGARRGIPTARLSALAIAVAAALAVSPQAARANYSIHGGYSSATDACAGCHRSHVPASPIQWEAAASAGAPRTLPSSDDMIVKEFCYACHDDAGQGADTNVQSGVYEGDACGSRNATLNGGGFEGVGGKRRAMTSAHYVDSGWGAFGGGTTGADAASYAPGLGSYIEMTCASCHDPHGSSNYRCLKDQVNGVTVGGYTPSETEAPVPDPWVLSAEEGYPVEGFVPGVAYPQYRPDFTTPRYAKAPASSAPGGTARGMAGWCASCHGHYASTRTVYDAGEGGGLAMRYRHPVGVPLSSYAGPRRLEVEKMPLPLAHDLSEAASSPPANSAGDWLDCLTCHVAHGTATVMTGYADVADARAIVPNSRPSTAFPGVPPDLGSALLRRDSRGVCEVCHDK